MVEYAFCRLYFVLILMHRSRLRAIVPGVMVSILWESCVGEIAVIACTAKIAQLVIVHD